MRDIKFRARVLSPNTTHKRWIYGTPIFDSEHKGSVAIHEGGSRVYVLVDPRTFGQYTNLKDKNGVEIYEGDLFGKMGGDEDRPDEYEIHAIVYFDKDLSAFCIDDNRGGWEYLFKYLNEPKNKKEIIGNIYEDDFKGLKKK